MEASALEKLVPGYQLGRYEIKNAISKGAMGEVYRAHNRVTEEDVAIKRLIDLRHAARFEIEARLLQQLDHPRVVKVVDHFQDTHGVYMVMELVEGEDLGQVLKKEGTPGLPVDKAIEYTRQTCEALDYVHDQQIIHRDVKPQNMILGKVGVTLVDFGVARELQEEEVGVDAGTAGIGTPRFMAPEVFAGGQVSARSDVFSVAATLWTLIVGKPPVYADPTKLSEKYPQVSPDLEATIRAGLEINPDHRVASISAFARALGERLESQGLSLALSLPRDSGPARSLIEMVVRTAAGIFDAAAASIALVDRLTGELVYQAAWGAGAREIVGVRLPEGKGIAGSVVKENLGVAVPDCRNDPRFAAQIAAGTGYVPYTMVVVPLVQHGSPVGVMSVLDRRDGGPYGPDEVVKAQLFADLALAALEVEPEGFTSLGAAAIPDLDNLPTSPGPKRPKQ